MTVRGLQLDGPRGAGKHQAVKVDDVQPYPSGAQPMLGDPPSATEQEVPGLQQLFTPPPLLSTQMCSNLYAESKKFFRSQCATLPGSALAHIPGRTDLQEREVR